MSTPPDPAEYSEGPERILARFQPGFPRWILCAPGWYPLLVDPPDEPAEVER